MSAMTLDAPSTTPSVRTTTAAGRFATLLRREYWEHRGGFLWAPIWAAGGFFGILLLIILAAEWHTSGTFNGEVHFGFPIQKLLAALRSQHAIELPQILDAGLMGLWAFLQVVMFFVLFFYCLGALYDDRKDRSVLFWKSLPVSNVETVLSKLATAVVVVPVIYFVFAALLQLAVLVLFSALVWFHGDSAMALIWGPAEPLATWAKMIAAIPLSALWALPTVGWLMFISAWARSKPFLWAVAVPVVVGILVGTFDIFEAVQLPDSWYWTHVGSRGLLSIYPGSWMFSDNLRAVVTMNQDGPPHVLDWNAMSALAGSANFWIGAIVGSGLLAGAVYFRRKREQAD